MAIGSPATEGVLGTSQALAYAGNVRSTKVRRGELA